MDMQTMWHYPVERVKGAVFSDRVAVDRWEFDRHRVYEQTEPDGLNVKPTGLWLSISEAPTDSWWGYCADAGFWPADCWRFPVRLDVSRLLVANDPSDIPTRWLLPLEPYQQAPEPDWQRIAAYSAGVVFPRFEQQAEESHWWNSLCATSACVWDLDVVVDVGEARRVKIHNGAW